MTPRLKDAQLNEQDFDPQAPSVDDFPDDEVWRLTEEEDDALDEDESEYEGEE